MLYIYKVNALVMKFNRILILILKVLKISSLKSIKFGKFPIFWELLFIWEITMKFGNLGKNKYVLIIYLLPNSCTKHILPWFGRLITFGKIPELCVFIYM